MLANVLEDRSVTVVRKPKLGVRRCVCLNEVEAEGGEGGESTMFWNAKKCARHFVDRELCRCY